MSAKVQTYPDGTQAAEFSYDFVLDQKAAEVTEDEHGDVYIEGYASDFGVDRQNEAFEPGAFDRGLKSYMETNPVLLYHHKFDQALGQIIDSRLDQKGLWVKARVDKPAPQSWAEDVFNKIKRGTIRAFSVGGIFKRRPTPDGPRIFDCDLAEISVTPFPVNPRTTFAVAAGKAFEGIEIAEPEAETDEAAELAELAQVEEALESLERLFADIDMRDDSAQDDTESTEGG